MSLALRIAVIGASLVIGLLSADKLRFEVAVVKPTNPEFDGGSVVQMALNDNRFTATGVSLKYLIQVAYTPGTGLLHSSLISGGSNWFDRDRYDIVAKAGGDGVASQDERRQMVKTLLEDRFKLIFHREIRQTEVYVLQVGKNGPKLRKRTSDDGGAPWSLMPDRGRNASMAELAFVLQKIIPLTDQTRPGLPVLDKTGLAGRFDFDLTWSGDQASNLPDLFTALRDQLGLKLDMAKAPVEVMVIDHAEKPSDN